MNDLFAKVTFDIPALVATVFALIFLLILVKWHADETRFDMRHVLIDVETGRVSLHKFGQFLALIVSTGLIWYEAVNGRLSEWLFGGYMIAWAGVAFGNAWLKSQQKTAPQWNPEKDGDRRRADRRMDEPEEIK